MSKNADYWRGRFSILEDSAFNQSEHTIEQVEQMYMEAQRSVQKEIEAWYGRFATNNGISLSDARKMLTTGQLKEFQWTVEQYIEAGKKAGLDPSWMKQLENASAKVHISRLEALQLQIQQQVELLNGGQVDSIDALLKQIVGGNYTHTAYEIQKGLGIGWDITALDQRKLETLISKPWTTDGRTFRDRCWTNKTELVNTINNQMVQGILRGDSPEKAIQAVQKQFGVSRYKARRLIHTETSYFNAQSTKESYRELGVEKIEILETLDGRTCEICGGLDGTVITLAQYEPGVTVPPFHPNCRGTTCPYFDDMDGERAARNADGKVYYVPADMKYTDWKAAFVGGGAKTGLTVALTAEQFDSLRVDAIRKQGELNAASQQLSSVKMDQKMAAYGGDQDRIDKLAEQEAALQQKITGLQDELDKIFKDAGIESDVGKRLFTSTIERLPVRALNHPLTPEEIIAKLGGGDKTKGSCSSLAFAYAGNHNGIDVVDFRGGSSQGFFATNKNIVSIAQLPGVKSVVEVAANDFEGTTTLLKTMVEDKLYYLATGQHAAIVRKVADGYEYLELQSAKNNGWFKLTKDTLKSRFGCKRSHSTYGHKFTLPNVLIDVDSLNGNQEFEQILGYINTAIDEQMKGVSGYAK